MLTRRVIPTIIIKEDRVVQSKGFKQHLPIGIPEIAVKYLADWGADEILLLDISASKLDKAPNYSMVEKCSINLQIPLTVGGGISTVTKARSVFNAGADKISINSSASSLLFAEIGELYGAQAIVFAIDVVRKGSKSLVYDHRKHLVSSQSVKQKILEIDNNLYGELLVQAVDRDGAECGFDIECLSKIEKHLGNPVIALGGYGTPDHLNELFGETSVSAGAIGNVMHHYEHSLMIAKTHLGLNSSIRLETTGDYDLLPVDSLGRILKRSNAYLNELFYAKPKKDVI